MRTEEYNKAREEFEANKVVWQEWIEKMKWIAWFALTPVPVALVNHYLAVCIFLGALVWWIYVVNVQGEARADSATSPHNQTL